MRPFGIKSNPGDLRLIALAHQGVSAETVKAACEQAKQSKLNEPIGPAYVLAIFERWAKEAAELKVLDTNRSAAAGVHGAAAPVSQAPGHGPQGPRREL